MSDFGDTLMTYGLNVKRTIIKDMRRLNDRLDNTRINRCISIFQDVQDIYDLEIGFGLGEMLQYG